MPDAFPAAILPLYTGLGQAPNMLACIPSGVVEAKPVQSARNYLASSMNKYVS